MKYIKIKWPEYQEYVEYNDTYYDPKNDVYFIPEDIVNSKIHKECYETFLNKLNRL